MQDSPSQLEPALTARLAIGVLAGGRSERMGQDKAWLDFGGQSLLAFVLERFAPLEVPRLVAAGAPDRVLPPLAADVRVVHDAVADRGPLRGLEALFAALPPGRDLLFACACDMPFVTPDLVGPCAERLGAADAVVPCTDGKLHGLCALYHARSAQALAATLAAGERSVRAWLTRLRVRELAANELAALGLDERVLRNVNDAPALAAARHELGRA